MPTTLGWGQIKPSQQHPAASQMGPLQAAPLGPVQTVTASGNAPAVKAKARQRIEDAADRMARELLKMAVDENVSDAVKLAAIRDALDRAGLSVGTAVSVAIAPKPWEQIFDDIAGGSRAGSRARRGMPDEDELNGIEPILDAEVIESEPDRTDLPPRWNAEPAHSAGRRTYTISDFER